MSANSKGSGMERQKLTANGAGDRDTQTERHAAGWEDGEPSQDAEKFRQICVPCIFITEPLCRRFQGGNGCADQTKTRTLHFLYPVCGARGSVSLVCSTERLRCDPRITEVRDIPGSCSQFRLRVGSSHWYRKDGSYVES